MRSLFRTGFGVFFLGCSFLLLSGCGQSGALYLPSADSVGTVAAQDAANASLAQVTPGTK